MRMWTMRLCAAALAICFLGVPGAGAEDGAWSFEIEPYAWLAGLTGEVTVNGYKADFDKSVTDLFDSLEFGGSLLGIARRDQWVVLGQFDYFSLDSDRLEIEDQPQGGSLDSQMLLGRLGLGYEFGDPEGGATCDVLLGVQGLQMENELQVNGLGKSSKDTDSVDPLLIARIDIPLMPSKVEGLRFVAPLAIGGGGDADLVYEVEAQLQYRFTETIDGRLGYRIVGYEYSDDSENELDFAQVGWTLGVGFRF